MEIISPNCRSCDVILALVERFESKNYNIAIKFLVCYVRTLSILIRKNFGNFLIVALQTRDPSAIRFKDCIVINRHRTSARFSARILYTKAKDTKT